MKLISKLFYFILICSSPLSADNSQNDFFQEEISPSMMDDQIKPAFYKMIFSLSAFLGLALASYWFFKRFTKGKMQNHHFHKGISILDRKALSQKTAIYYIQIEDQTYLIAESQHQVQIMPAETNFESKEPKTGRYNLPRQDLEKQNTLSKT